MDASRSSTTCLWATGRPAPDTNAKAAQAAGIAPAPVADPEIEAELARNMKLAGELGATGTPLFVVGDRVMNGAVGYDSAQRCDRQGSPEELTPFAEAALNFSTAALPIDSFLARR